MTQIPAGWYPDPDPEQTAPGAQRYWDGRQWTEHVHTPSPPEQQAPQAPWGQPGQPGGPDQPTAYPSYGTMPPGPAGPMPGADLAQGGSRDFTPDGQRLSGWWMRVAAYLLDSLAVSLVVVVLAWSWVRDIATAYGDLVREATTAAEGGGAQPDPAQLVADIAGPLAVVTVVGLVVNFVYQVGFLKWRAATPGKMLLGLKVRLRERPGPLSWGTVLKRWLGQNWYVAVSVVPLLGSITSLWPLIDGLWPLWDGKRQALHDKVASTNVVRARR